jgi:hypothetical protein
VDSIEYHATLLNLEAKDAANAVFPDPALPDTSVAGNWETDRVNCEVILVRSSVSLLPGTFSLYSKICMSCFAVSTEAEPA